MPGSRTSSSSSCVSDLASASRHQRNLAEKQRRDKLNGYINELANIVPMVSMATKRLDKTSILRLSAAHIRIYQNLGCHRRRMLKGSSWRPKFLTSEHLSDILEAVEGFVMVTSSSGKIMYVSQSVEQFLGHQHIEMIGHSLYPFVHAGDHETLKTQFQNLSEIANQKNGNGISSERCSFFCRMKERGQPRSEVITYQLVHITGHVTSLTDEDDEGDDTQEKSSSGASASPNPLFKAFVRLVHSNPHTELSLTDALEDEYVTRHKIDGTIIYADHRLSYITGHLPYEVINLSAYHFISPEDIPVTLFAHKFMFANATGIGMTVYRLRTRSSNFVYLRSFGYLQYDKTSNQIKQFICVNKLLPEEEGKRELKKFAESFTPHVIEGITNGAEAIQSLENFTLPFKLQSLEECRSSEEEMTVDINLSTPSSCTTLDSPPDSWVASLSGPMETESDDTLGERFPALRAAIASPPHFTDDMPPSTGNLNDVPLAASLVLEGNAQMVLDQNLPRADLSIAAAPPMLKADIRTRPAMPSSCQGNSEPTAVQCMDACCSEITKRKRTKIDPSQSPETCSSSPGSFDCSFIVNGNCHSGVAVHRTQERNWKDECSPHVKAEPANQMDTCLLSSSGTLLCIRSDNGLDSAKLFLDTFSEPREIHSQSTSPVGLNCSQRVSGAEQPHLRVNGQHQHKSGHRAHSMCSCSDGSCHYCVQTSTSSSVSGLFNGKETEVVTAKKRTSSTSSSILRDRSAHSLIEEQHPHHLSLISSAQTPLGCPVDPHATR